jgi:hypothetical protein
VELDIGARLGGQPLDPAYPVDVSLRAWIWVAAVGLASFVAIVAMQGVLLIPSFDPGHQQISEYVHSPAGAVMVVGFLCWALSLAVLVGLIARVDCGDRLAHPQAGALLLAAVAVVVLAIFPTDRGTAIPGVVTHASLTGQIHDAASAATAVGIFVAALVGAARRGGPVRALSLALVGIGIAASIVLLALGDPLPGGRQRVLVAVGCLWQAAWLLEMRLDVTPTSAGSSAGSRCSTS